MSGNAYVQNEGIVKPMKIYWSSTISKESYKKSICKKEWHVFYLLGSFHESSQELENEEIQNVGSSYESFQELENEESQNEGVMLIETGSGSSE